MADRRQITVAGITLTVLIERKAVKNINARLRDTTLHIGAPHAVDDATLDSGDHRTRAPPDSARS